MKDGEKLFIVREHIVQLFNISQCYNKIGYLHTKKKDLMMHLIHQSLFFILCSMCQNLLIITSCFHCHMPPLNLNTSNTNVCWTTFILDALLFAMDLWSPLNVCVQCADNVLIVSFDFGWIVSPLYSIKINFLYLSFQLLLLLVVLAKVSIL